MLNTQVECWKPKLSVGNPGGGVLPYIGYTGMFCWKGYGFQAI